MRVREDSLVSKAIGQGQIPLCALPWPCVVALDQSFYPSVLFFPIHNFYHSLYDFSAYGVSNGLALICVFQKGDLIFTAASRYYNISHNPLMIMTGSDE